MARLSWASLVTALRGKVAGGGKEGSVANLLPKLISIGNCGVAQLMELASRLTNRVGAGEKVYRRRCVCADCDAVLQKLKAYHKGGLISARFKTLKTPRFNEITPVQWMEWRLEARSQLTDAVGPEVLHLCPRSHSHSHCLQVGIYVKGQPRLFPLPPGDEGHAVAAICPKGNLRVAVGGTVYS